MLRTDPGDQSKKWQGDVRIFPQGHTDKNNCINLQVSLMSVKALPGNTEQPEGAENGKKTVQLSCSAVKNSR